MTEAPAIRSVEPATRACLSRVRYEGYSATYKPGMLLRMTDGSAWFHPYDGSAPFKPSEDNKA